MFTNKDTIKPIKVYRVLFEHRPTGITDHMFIESTSSYEASTSIMNRLGNEYDLIICVSVKKNRLN
jgi:hypothetical protein